MRVPSQPVRRLQTGLTLIEVMVGITIGLILLVALGSMLVGSIKHFKVSDEFSRMQENGAFALNALGRDIRMAGFYGQIGSNDVRMADVDGNGVADANPVPTANDCGSGWAIDTLRPIFGYAGRTSANVNAVMPCILGGDFGVDGSNFVDNSPILILRGAGGEVVTAPEDGVLYVQSSPGGGIIFDGNDYEDPMPNPVPSPWRTRPDGTAADVYAYQPRAYYLRPCSRPAGTECATTDDDGRPIPTLVRQELNGLAMVEQPVAEGIERMNILYGLDDATVANRDGYPNEYVVAPAAADWERVVAIRVALLVRSPTPTKGYNDANKSYDLDGDNVAEFTCTPGVNCDYHRHVFTQTFQARNLSARLQQ